MNKKNNLDKTDIPLMEWEDAFFHQYQAASIGQMFQGILHNLNGVNQAFSLQAALLNSTFSKASQLLEKVEKSNDQERLDYIKELQEMIKSRGVLAGQMESKIEENNSIIKRALPLAELYESTFEKTISINRIIKSEIDILTSISFFKHDVQKNYYLDDTIPPISHSFEKIHSILYVVILNAIEALLDSDVPELIICTKQDSTNISVQVMNVNASPFEISPQIFKPFFTTKEGHLGLGLYLADKNIKELGGDILVSQEPKGTCFTILFPIQG